MSILQSVVIDFRFPRLKPTAAEAYIRYFMYKRAINHLIININRLVGFLYIIVKLVLFAQAVSRSSENNPFVGERRHHNAVECILLDQIHQVN